MFRGRFGDTTGRPYVEGRLFFRRLNITGNVSFLLDTGADRSLLNPLDGLRLAIDYSKLQGSAETTGISGPIRHFVEPAFVMFTDPGRYLYVYSVELAINPVVPEIMELPSLLGRDVLDRWSMVYNPSKKRLVFRVISADFEIPI